MAEGFLINSANKNDFNEVLAKKFHRLYRGDQICILSYRNRVLTNHPEQMSMKVYLWENTSLRKLINGWYVIDYNAFANKSTSKSLFELLTLISLFFRYRIWEVSDLMTIQSSMFTLRWQTILCFMIWEESLYFSDQTYGKHCLSSMHLLDAISFLASTGKESMKRGTRGWAMNTKILTPIYFQD